LKACHAISVSTEAIAELVRPINPNVAVFPNQIKAIGPKREYVESDVVRIYMGGQRKREDWGDVVKIVNEVVAGRPDRCHFVVVHDRDLYDALETKHKTFYAFQPYEKYRALLRTCDVAILALGDTRLNRCKSDITQIECGAEGVAVLRNDRDPWILGDRTVLNLGTGHPEMMIRYALDHHVRSGTAESAYTNIVNNRMLAGHYRNRADWFNKLLDEKAELESQLFERLPELKEVGK
jgi:hypothetical protein